MDLYTSWELSIIGATFRRDNNLCHEGQSIMRNVKAVRTTWCNSLHHDAAELQLPPPSYLYLALLGFSPPNIQLVLQPAVTTRVIVTH